MVLRWFASAVVRRPGAVVATVAALSLGCLVVPFAARTTPDFSDPEMVSDGFR